MRFRQKPPTEPGLYLVVAVGESYVGCARVHENSDHIDCTNVPEDGYNYEGCNPYSHKHEIALWCGPLKVPSWKYPKRLLYLPKPAKKPPIPATCRRWGHKIEEYTPEIAEDSTPMFMKDDTVHRKCVRCGKSFNYSRMYQQLAESMREML